MHPAFLLIANQAVTAGRAAAAARLARDAGAAASEARARDEPAHRAAPLAALRTKWGRDMRMVGVVMANSWDIADQARVTQGREPPRARRSPSGNEDSTAKKRRYGLAMMRAIRRRS
ncbi:hypothetical protein EYA82_30900 [Burkholderia pseudomallei]|nr:hypothetical protein EYA82_30900 [Burkholderia pseudomallei]